MKNQSLKKCAPSYVRHLAVAQKCVVAQAVAQKWRCGFMKNGLSKNRPNSMKSSGNMVPGVFLHGNHESAIGFLLSRTSEP